MQAAPLHSTPPPAPSTTAPLPAASPSGKSAALQAQLVEEASRLRQEVLADTRRLQQLQAKQAAGGEAALCTYSAPWTISVKLLPCCCYWNELVLVHDCPWCTRMYSRCMR